MPRAALLKLSVVSQNRLVALFDLAVERLCPRIETHTPTLAQRALRDPRRQHN